MSSSSPGHARVVASAGTVGGLTLLSRVCGLARDVMTATVFGTGAVWDAFVLAFTVPNLFRRIFGEGALTSAFLPAAVKIRREEGRDAAARLTSGVATVTGVFLLGVALATAAGCGAYLWISGSAVGDALTVYLLVVLIFYLPFICVSAVLQAALNAVGHFAVPAFTPVLLNLVWIAGLVLVMGPFAGWSMHGKIFFLAAAVVAGGVLQCAVQVPVLHRKRMEVSPDFGWKRREVRGVFSAMVPVVLALVVMQVNVLVDRLLAAWMIEGHGAISALFYGNRLIQLPLAVFGVALGVAVFPSLRETVVEGEHPRTWKLVNFGMRLLLLVVVPSAAGLVVLGKPVIRLFFDWGAFAGSPDAARRVYFVTAAYSIGLVFFSFNILFTRVFHAFDERRFPARVAGLMVLLNLGLNLLFLTLTPLREAGLALSTSITAFANMLLLLRGLVRRHGFGDFEGVAGAGMRALAAAAVMGAAVLLTAGNPAFPFPGGLGGRFLRVGAGVAAGVILYALGLALLRAPELKRFVSHAAARARSFRGRSGQGDVP